MTVTVPTKIPNYINGRWIESSTGDWLNVINPATSEQLARVPLSGLTEVAEAVDSAAAAYLAWRHTPSEDRIQPLFKLSLSMMALYKLCNKRPWSEVEPIDGRSRDQDWHIHHDRYKLPRSLFHSFTRIPSV